MVAEKRRLLSRVTSKELREDQRDQLLYENSAAAARPSSEFVDDNLNAVDDLIKGAQESTTTSLQQQGQQQQQRRRRRRHHARQMDKRNDRLRSTTESDSFSSDGDIHSAYRTDTRVTR